MKRRAFIGAGGVAFLSLNSGCLSTVADTLTRTEAGAAVFYRPSEETVGGGQVAELLELGYETTDIVNITPTIEGSIAGLSGDVDIDGWIAISRLTSDNSDIPILNQPLATENTENLQNEYDPNSFNEYINQNGVIGEQYVLALPNAEPPGADAPIRELTPEAAFDAIIGSNSSGDDGNGGESPAKKVVKFKPGAELAEKIKLTGLSTNGRMDEAAAPVVGNSDVSGGNWTQWGHTAELKGGTISNSLLAGVSAELSNEDGGVVTVPAHAYLRRIQYEKDYLYVGGWVLDAGAVYQDSATVLIDGGANELIALSESDLAAGDKKKVRERFSRSRSSHGAAVYTGPPTKKVLPFLPESLQNDTGIEQFHSVSKRSARKGRNPQTGKEIKIPAKKKLDSMSYTIQEIQLRLEGCNSDLCQSIRSSADGREEVPPEVQTALDNDTTDDAISSLQGLRRTIERDIERLQNADEGADLIDVLGLEYALLRQTERTIELLNGDDVTKDIEARVAISEKSTEGDHLLGSEEHPVAKAEWHLEGETVATIETVALREGRKGMNAVDVRRTDLHDDGTDEMFWSVETTADVREKESGEEYFVHVTVVVNDNDNLVPKGELIDSIASRADIANAAAHSALDAFIDTTTKALKKGNRVAVVETGADSIGSTDPEGSLQTLAVSLDAPIVYTDEITEGQRDALIEFGAYSASDE